MYIPPHFVRSHQGQLRRQRKVFDAELDFSVSENPTLRFNFVPHGQGELKAEVEDSKDGQLRRHAGGARVHAARAPAPLLQPARGRRCTCCSRHAGRWLALALRPRPRPAFRRLCADGRRAQRHAARAMSSTSSAGAAARAAREQAAVRLPRCQRLPVLPPLRGLPGAERRRAGAALRRRTTSSSTCAARCRCTADRLFIRIGDEACPTPTSSARSATNARAMLVYPSVWLLDAEAQAADADARRHRHLRDGARAAGDPAPGAVMRRPDTAAAT